MMDTAKPTLIGYIHACIGGDRRYSSRLEVYLRRDGQADVILSENGAVGGMDGQGGATPYAEVRRETVQAKAGDIVRAIKRVMDATIRDYGKPSKRFAWVRDHRQPDCGLSAARCEEALFRAGPVKDR